MAKRGGSALMCLEEALRQFVTAASTQGQQHIRPFHKYVAARRVLECGFHPDEVSPPPPLSVTSRGRSHLLVLDPKVEDSRERTSVD